MLANILPGLRDLRAPLVAGYVFLVGLWFLVSPSTVAPKGNSGYDLGYHLGQFAGRAAVLAAASLVAFFIGLLLQQTGQLVTLLYSTLYYSRGRCRGETFFDQAGRSSAEKLVLPTFHLRP